MRANTFILALLAVVAVSASANAAEVAPVVADVITPVLVGTPAPVPDFPIAEEPCWYEHKTCLKSSECGAGFKCTEIQKRAQFCGLTPSCEIGRCAPISKTNPLKTLGLCRPVVRCELLDCFPNTTCVDRPFADASCERAPTTCRKFKNCPKKDYRPVCGLLKNGKLQTFRSSCRASNACAKVVYSGPCIDLTPPKPSCPTAGNFCPLFFDPVCGTDVNGDRVTAGNGCQASSQCLTDVVPGACEDVVVPETPTCATANQICTREFNPVCGIDANGVTKTFATRCVAESLCAKEILREGEC